MKVVYIAGKFRGPNAWQVHQHICEAERWAFKVAQLGAMPLCPHTMELLRLCDGIFLTPNWINSTGARAECREGMDLGMPIIQDIVSLRGWLAGESTGLENYELFALQMQSTERERRFGGGG